MDFSPNFFFDFLRKKFFWRKFFSPACINSQIWVNFGQKGQFFKFPWKIKAVIIFWHQILGSLQRIGNSNVQFSKKMRKTLIFWHFGPKRPILDQFWPKRGHFRIFGEKAKMSLFYSFFFIFQYWNCATTYIFICLCMVKMRQIFTV